LLRARETAASIARAAGLAPEPDERLAPGAVADDVRDVVAGRGETVVVVGHQPDCGQIAAELGDGSEPRFPPAGVVELELGS
jgi:phosphohistidine phosphatase SixA